MLEPQRADRYARWLMPIVALAALLGGSVFWARRVGWLQAETYWYAHGRLLDWYDLQTDRLAAYETVMRFNAILHDSSGWLWLAKLPKELVALALLLIAATQIARLRLPRVFTLAYVGLFALAAASALSSLLAGGWMALIAGARSFVPWLFGAIAAPISNASLLRLFARVCAWTLVVEGVLVAIEVQTGLLIYSMKFFDVDLVRAVGSFNLPISLGTFAVVAWAAAWCWGEFTRRAIVALSALLIAVLIATASGSAWFAFGAAVLVGVLNRLPLRARVLLLLAALPLSVLAWFALPQLTGRMDIHDSLWGRIYPVQQYAARHLSAREIAFGSGFGRGTNAHSALAESSTAPVDATATAVGDSTPASLIWQVGLVGLALAYALILLALHADARSRPIGIAILVSSISVNVTELFPVNIALGFWLAHAARERDRHGRAD